MTDLSISKTLAPAAEKLTDEQFAERRRGIIAALQMMNDAMWIAGQVKYPQADDAAFYADRDRAFDDAREQALHYLRSFGAQPEHAQRGFADVMGTFFAHFGEDDNLSHPHDYWKASSFANPPLRMSELCGPEGEMADHNGELPSPQQFVGGARSWLGPIRVEYDSPSPQTAREGQARFIRMFRELEDANAKRTACRKSERLVSATLRSTALWPAKARSGFEGLLAEWLQALAMGLAPRTEHYAERYGDPADEARFAALKGA